MADDRAGDIFPFTVRVGGDDDAVGFLELLFDVRHLLAFTVLDLVFVVFRENRQVVQAPFFPFRIIFFRLQQPQKMSRGMHDDRFAIEQTVLDDVVPGNRRLLLKRARVGSRLR